MSTDSSEQTMALPAQAGFFFGTRSLHVKHDGPLSRGSVILLMSFCHSVTLFDSDVCFFFYLINLAVFLCGRDRFLEIGR